MFIFFRLWIFRGKLDIYLVYGLVFSFLLNERVNEVEKEV